MLSSSVGKKLLMGFTGLGLFTFVTIHLAENLLLLSGNKTLYNEWTHFLESFGAFLYVIELGLVAFFVVHIIYGIVVWLGKRRARPESYAKSANAGGPSKKTVSSLFMVWTGVLVLIFIVLHVANFKYGPNIAEGYVQQVEGQQIRDLHQLVIDTFRQPVWMIWYVAAMVLLGFHLRHGFWSAFQSLGVMNPGWTRIIYGLGVVLAVLIAFGFAFLPVWIYFGGGGA
jgi:succinate dehydrogenase / fumarate reductase cytochrome b subunit